MDKITLNHNFFKCPPTFWFLLWGGGGGQFFGFFLIIFALWEKINLI
jgi:hypothetical protein